MASRIYAYPNIAAYETVRKAYPEKFMTLAGQLNGLTTLPNPTATDINFHLAAIHAFQLVGKKLIFSEEKMEAYWAQLYASLRKDGLPKSVLNSSLEYGEQVAKHILMWADKDM